jgi:hypothetical protein
MSRNITGVAGVLLLALGGYVLVQGASITTKRNVVELGDVKITADERQPIPPWAGGLAVGIGAALLVVGVRRRP